MQDLWIDVKDKKPTTHHKRETLEISDIVFVVVCMPNGNILGTTAVFTRGWRGSKWVFSEQPYFDLTAFVTHWQPIIFPENVKPKPPIKSTKQK